MQAEGAHLIGDNGAILGAPGKAVSHAVVAGIAAEIGGGNGQGAAAGALAAELAGVILGDNIIKPEEWQKKSEQQAQMARVLGSVAGAVFTGKAEGANSGATGGEAAFRYNYLSHKQKELMDQDLSSAKTPLEKAFVLARWGVTSGKQDGAFAAGVISGVPVEFVETAQSLIALVTNPGEAWDALKALINEDDAWAKVSTSVKQGYISRIDTLKAEYEKAGIDGAYYSGLEFGKLTTEAAGVLVGVAGALKGSLILAEKTIKAAEKTWVKTVPVTGPHQQLIKNADYISTAKNGQTIVPRDLNEQIFWDVVRSNPSRGNKIENLNNDIRFPTDAGFQKMELTHTLPDNTKISIHYQYNINTNKAYDMKIVTPQRNAYQPGPSLDRGMHHEN